MAMLITLFVSILAFFQATYGMMFVAPQNPPLTYGGAPYEEKVIEEFLPVYENGVTNYAVVIPDDASDSVKTGARWLKEFLEQMSGGTLAQYTASQSAQRVADGFDRFIALGGTGLDNGALDADIAALGDEAFVKKVVGDNIFIYGVGRGTMYGCASFIEEELGCRWFTPDLKVIPESPDISIDKNLYSVQSTALEYRDVFWGVVNQSPEWKAFHKINTGMGSYIGVEYGYGVNYIDFCHTMERLVPASYYAGHPEYFSWRADQKAWTLEQRCLTNPDVLAITIENTLAQIRNAPPDYKIMSVTQNDNSGVCQCANCLAKDAELGGPSGTNIWFVNQVARAVKAEFPDREIYIDTFAYDYTTQAPTVIIPGVNTPDDNVIVRLCSIGSCFCHPIDECGHFKGEGFFDTFKEKPSQFAKDIENWSAICDKLYIWDYTTNFKTYSMPFPNLHVLSNNIQFFIENNVVGLFEQGNYDGGRNGEFDALRAYLLAKLMWTPEANVEHLMQEFMNAYYGEASAPYIKEYIDYISDKAVNTSHLFIFNRPEQNVYFSASECKKLDALWDKAEQNANDDTQLENIRRSRLSLRHYKANMMVGEFSLLNPSRMSENKQLFHDSVMLGMRKFKETDPICEPYSEYVWAMRPIEWGDPIAWVDFVDESKVIPLDIDAYIAAHQS
ncbi:MAG: DUF4838 domain-containing protein [Oscillospiraceae bacterium]|jgi:hypothetical protein|nr:DUF4838 domain-containing protein [Oscillospiraceae bacterium]